MRSERGARVPVDDAHRKALEMRTRFERPTPIPVGISFVAILLLTAMGIEAVAPSIPDSRARIPNENGPVGPAAVSAGPGDIRTLSSRTALAPVQAETDRRDRGRCPECGVVESMRRTEQSGGMGAKDNVDLDRTEAAFGSAAAGNAIAERGYAITVRIRDGSRTIFNEASPRNWRPGSRVIVIGRANASSD
jgi:hypothetical protein